MPIRVTHVHLANSPRHIRRGPRNLQCLRDTSLVGGIDIVDPDRHPDPLVAALIAARAKGHPGIAFAASALRTFTKKYFAITGADATKRWRISPVPCLGPSQLLEPIEALLYVGDVQNRCQSFCFHR